jgi:hypothetical protein
MLGRSDLVRRRADPREDAPPRRVSPPESKLPPPTIGYLRRDGLDGVIVQCANIDCRRTADISWDAIGLPEDTPFPEIVFRARFRCAGCGQLDCYVSPNWRGYMASGNGG